MKRSLIETKRQELAPITSEKLALILNSPLGGTLEKPFTKQLFLMNTYVAGTNHVRYFRKYLKEIRKGDRVRLIREPENKHDKFAVLIKTEKKHKLGYLPRVKNKVIARLLDAGKPIYGIVEKKVEPVRRYQMVWYLKIDVFMDD